jgi:hypothetical protein
MNKNQVLVLGDGNFSFSLALVKNLHTPQAIELVSDEDVEITSTSFDSKEKLLMKYPETSGILPCLSKYAQIHHQINGIPFNP